MLPFHRVILSSLVVFVSTLLTASQVMRAVSPTDPVPYEALPIDVSVETIVPDVNQLVAMAFTPDGRLLYTEKTGKVRVVAGDVLLPAAAYDFSGRIDTQGERGLLGIAVDPAFVVNNRVWVYLTRDRGSTTPRYQNRVVTFVLPDDNVVTETATAKSFPVDVYSTIHNGGNLHFGPDGKLYVTVGNNDETNLAADPSQSLSSPLGKLHRFMPAIPLKTPTDNPFGYSSVYARGLRNSFDFDFDPVSGALYATENGEACDDEVNRILPGYNYGWRPYYPCDDAAPGGPDPAYNSIPPLIDWTPSLAPTGLTFYTSDLIPEWKNDLFMCNYKDATTAIHHFKLNAARTALVSHTILSDTINHQPITCRTDLLTGPEGALYYSEGGGYPENNGPIKRLIRRTSFADSTASVQTAHVVADGQAKVLIALRHRGTDPNSVTVTIDAGSQSEIIDAQTTRGAIVPTAPQMLLWSSTVNGTEAVTATYTLHIAATSTSPYLIANQIQIDAPGATSVDLTPLIIVNGFAAYLPIVWR